MEEDKLTKKEKRKLAKEEKQKEQQRQDLTGKAQKYATWLIVAAIVGFLGYKFVKFLTAPLPQTTQTKVEATENDHILGDKQAKAVLIEYGDFQCPACKSYYPVVKQLSQDYQEGLEIVYRNMPLASIHKNALNAAAAAEAASLQDKYWEMHDSLFEYQDDWAELSDPKDKFVEYAKEIGLDTDKFVSDYESKEIRDKVDSDMQSALALGINSTPTFFLNGSKVSPRSLEEFKSLIDEQLQN